MDPVCMLTIYPQLLRNFVYKMPDPTRLHSLLGFVDSLRFVFSRDLMVAEVMSRHKSLLHALHLPSLQIGRCKYLQPSCVSGC